MLLCTLLPASFVFLSDTLWAPLKIPGMPTPELHVGSKVRARFGATEHGAVGTKFFPGTVTKLYVDGRVDITYDDGDEERGVEARLIRKLPLSPLDIAQENGHAAVVALLEEHQK